MRTAPPQTAESIAAARLAQLQERIEAGCDPDTGRPSVLSSQQLAINLYLTWLRRNQRVIQTDIQE